MGYIIKDIIHVMAAEAAIHAAIRASSACLPETAACVAVTVIGSGS